MMNGQMKEILYKDDIHMLLYHTMVLRWSLVVPLMTENREYFSGGNSAHFYLIFFVEHKQNDGY